MVGFPMYEKPKREQQRELQSDKKWETIFESARGSNREEKTLKGKATTGKS